MSRGSSTTSLASRLIDEGLWRQLGDRCRALEARRGLPPDVRRSLRRLTEAMDPGDWAKLGVLLGIAWWRLDRLIGQLEVVSKSTQGAEKNTAATVARLDALTRLLGAK